MIRSILLLTTLVIFLSSNSYALVGGTVVYDPEVDKKIGTLDKNLREQTKKITSMEEIMSDIDDSLKGNTGNSYSILSNQSFNDDITGIKIPHLMIGKKLRLIEKELNRLYPTQDLEFSKEAMERGRQQQQKQAELKQVIVYSTNIINTSKVRNLEIENLVREVDQKRTLKESVDLQNKIAIENLIELKKNNILFASLVRNQAKEQYKGLVNLKMEDENKEEQEENQRRRGFQKRYPDSLFDKILNK